MASPYKHPKTGMFWFRRRVPEHVRAITGKTIEQRSLRTKDVQEAKRKYIQVAAEVEREWATATTRQTPQTRRLTPFQINGLAGEFYRWSVEQHVETARASDGWQQRAEQDMRTIRPPGNRPGGAFGLYLPEVQRFLKERGILIDDSDEWDLAIAGAKAGVHAKETLARHAKGDYSDDPRAAQYPKWERVEPNVQIASRRLTIADHFDLWVKENGLEPATRKKYRTCIKDLCRSLGSDNLNEATREKLLKWKQELIDRPLKPQGISEGHFTAARSFFEWAVNNNKATTNPMVGITIKVPKEHKARMPYFTDEEAALILSETLRTPDPRLSAEMAAARRWIPWILAYTGARVNEITALCAEDVRLRALEEGGGVWVMYIRRTKMKEPRWVPLHPHLEEQGFPAFLKSRGTGPLFYDPARGRGASEENPHHVKIGGRIASWVRQIGVDDEDVDPNHGWRHRFKFVAKRLRMNPEIRDAICGHKPRTEGEEYGGAIDYDMMWPEIIRLPRYEVEPAAGPRKATPAREKASRDRAATAARAKTRGRPTKASVSDPVS